MSVRIDLDNSTGGVFTSLDNVSGRAIMNIHSEETISSITVKLEGISRTRLEHPRLENPGERPREKRRAEVEIHRLLYVVQTVFPTQAIRENTSPSNTGFTLKAGQYIYPFSIRIPINSACTEGARAGLLQRVSFDASNGTVDYAKETTRHIKVTLPPSLSGLPGNGALIQYFLKVTVNRPAFYKTNLRHYDPFVFLPIEPPRPPPTNAEAFARRKYEFIIRESATKKHRGIFSTLHKQEPITSPVPVRFTIEARLPSPPILVPNEPLPLRLLLTKLEPFTNVVIMRSLQITLLATTRITAHELFKDVLTQWLLLSVADLRLPFGDENSPPNVALVAETSLWHDKCLPDSVSPTFVTCNISRSYQLKIEIGLSQVEGHIDILPLLLPIEVYSGIQPPKQLLDSALYSALPQQYPVNRKTGLTVPQISTRKGSYSINASSAGPPVSPIAPPLPARPHSSSGRLGGSGVNELAFADSLPPPTYEDAIANEYDIAPVDGPRRRYEQEGAYYQPPPDDASRMGH